MREYSTPAGEHAKGPIPPARGFRHLACVLGSVLVAATSAATARATSLGPDFAPHYTVTEVATTLFPGFGCPFFVPQSTGILLLPTEPTYSLSIGRDPDGHINAITSVIEQPFDDGLIAPGTYSVAVAPNGALLMLGYLTENDFGITELKPGQTSPSVSTPITAPQLAGPNYGFIGIAPDSLGGGGSLKFLRGGTWFDLALTGPESTGPNASLYGIAGLVGAVVLNLNPTGGQLAFVAAGTPGFASNAVLFPDDSDGNHSVVAYDLDAHANPIPATRREFLLETDPLASSIRGVIVDPVTGDFLVISGETQHLTAVRKRPSVAPTVVITSPIPGSVLPPGPVAVTATVTGGTVATSYVRFYEQGKSEGFAQSTGEPFSGTARDLAPGVHTIFARATDVNGLTTESPHITFTVAPTPKLTISRFKADGVQLTLTGVIDGARYALEWLDVPGLSAGIGGDAKWARASSATAAEGIVVWEFPEAIGLGRLYRSVLLQP